MLEQIHEYQKSNQDLDELKGTVSELKQNQTVITSRLDVMDERWEYVDAKLNDTDKKIEVNTISYTNLLSEIDKIKRKNYQDCCLSIKRFGFLSTIIIFFVLIILLYSK